ncbi:heat shock 70 kDa protein 12A-like isoform X2 [Mya arenaria]|uniref:heat shock 70 kDa protein 12A-like isoform X2 n=1 Tax=Mya arenaria TaxID=6604 RepID=UPI0022E2566E|nr:heat shock 70 kDa protein 12A-like isoform X2 [Mya arenaria]
MASKQVQCEMCCKEHAVGFCNTCGNIGDSCVEIHKTGRAFKTHILKMYGKGGYNPRRIMSDITEDICKDHPAERTPLFCKTHDTMICGRCLHSDHLSCENVDLCKEAKHIDYDQANDMNQALSEIKDELKRIKDEVDQKIASSNTHTSKCNKELNDLENKLKGNVDDSIKAFRKETCKINDENNDAFSYISSICEEKLRWVEKEESQIDDFVSNSLPGYLYVLGRKFNKNISEVKRQMKEVEYKHTFKNVCLKENNVALKCLIEDLRDICEVQEEVDGSDEGITNSLGSPRQETQMGREELIEALRKAKFDADKAKTNRKAPKDTLEKPLLVAAFEFGTTFSGYAFSFRYETTQIRTNGAFCTEPVISAKVPTCVLLNPQKEFDAFGSDAEYKYMNLVEEGKHKPWMLFRRFRMLFHNNDGISRYARVKDITGKKMSAMTIFEMSIRYLRDHLINALTRHVGEIKESDILYVITVPAIWNDAAKEFMRKAALRAGLDNDRIKLALEPEAASIWCQHIDISLKTDLSKTGSQYMVVDLGGETADISVHEKNFDGTLKEIHKASGGPWGGTCVDQNFISCLTNIFGETTMSKFKEKHMDDYYDLLRVFETKKRIINPEMDGLVRFSLPNALISIYDETEQLTIKEKLEKMKIADDVALEHEKLRVSADFVRSWFSESIEKTTQHMIKLLSDSNMMNVSTILLVGGYGECMLVQDAVNKKIRNKKIIIPQDAGLAVLKGAVLFGHFYWLS